MLVGLNRKNHSSNFYEYSLVAQAPKGYANNMPYFNLWIAFVLGLGCQLASADIAVDGKAANHNKPFSELPESARPNDAAISLYQDQLASHIERRKAQGRLYTIHPKGNAAPFKQASHTSSQALEKELANGYIVSYLFYASGVIQFNGKAKEGRFGRDINDATLFATHSTGKSISSYIVGHAICEGYISSIDEAIDWPMMRNTLYQGQPLRNLLNMNAGDKHTVDPNSSYVMGSTIHHRDLGLDTIAQLLEGTKKSGDEVFYNNFLTDVLANYVVFKAGSHYDGLMHRIFQDKVKIQHAVAYEKHKSTPTQGQFSNYYGQAQTLASYSYYMTRMDFLRVAEAMMKDYQNQTCVGQYLKNMQSQAKVWPKYRPNTNNSNLWVHTYAKKYGGQFYFDFYGMDERNVVATIGLHGQNMIIDMDNARIVVTNSAATGWDQRSLLLNVIKTGELPQ